MKLTNSQSKAVNQLLESFENRENTRNIYFKAPTGSGKTFMASEFISRVLFKSIAEGRKAIFIFATVSNAELPLQLTNKLNGYKKYHDFSTYEVNYINSPSKNNLKIDGLKELDVKENIVYIFGKSSFGKNTLFYQNGTLTNFFERAHNEGYEVYYIRDEAHIGGNKKLSKSEEKNFEQIMFDNCSFIVEMTATPKGSSKLIEIKNEDLENDEQWLLKDKEVKTNLEGEVSNEEIIDDAIKEFKKSKNEYSKLEQDINPAMLIQVMNESEVNKSIQKEFEENLKILEDKLLYANLTYLKIIGNKRVVVNTKAPNTLEYASKNDSIIDVIIFKVGPATGWDIPRANMLLQLRNVSSESLNIQTLGRIMRNPMKDLSRNETTRKYYLYSNFQKPTRNAASYILKEKHDNTRLVIGQINRESDIYKNDDKEFYLLFKKFLSSNEFTNAIKDINEEKIIYSNINYNNAKVSLKIKNIFKLKIFNLNKEIEYKKIFNMTDIYDEILDLSVKYNVNVEIIKYLIWKFGPKIREIKNSNLNWNKNIQSYKLKESDSLIKSYNIWIDNEQNKKVFSNKDFGEKYGYSLISNDEDIQWLDSTPEMEFYKNFKNSLSKEQLSKISFFAKMPTLGSKVYFEYFCNIDSIIKKSFMDFAIIYNNKIIMIEVKSKDNDYDKEKTLNLQNAYKNYMMNCENDEISLILYQYGENSDLLSAYIDGEWKEDWSFREVFDNILK